MRDATRHLRTILASRTTRELMVYGFFVILSAAAWLMQVLHDNYDVDVSVPLSLDEVPDGVVITDSLPSALTVKVNDRGTTLMTFFLGSRHRPVSIPFTDYNTSRPIGTVRVGADELHRHVQTFLPASTRIVRILGDSISFGYNRGISRRLPVRLTGTYEAQQHMYVHSVRLTPDSVTVYAPTSVLDTMTAAPTLPLDLHDLRSDHHVTARMAGGEGMCCIPDTVGVNLHIDAYTEKKVEVPITGVNFPAGKQLRTFPSRVTVTFRVGMANYNAVTSSMFAITVSYEDLVRTGRCRLRLKSLPDGVSNARLSQSEVDFLIEQ